MRREPGPLPLFTDAQLPTPGPRHTFAALAAREAAILEAAAGSLSTSGGRLAPAVAGPVDLAAASDLAAAIAAHDRQSRESDSAIGAVAGDADTLEGVLAGLTNELGRELEAAANPPAVPAPPTENQDDRFDPEFADIVREYYQKFLEREASDEEIEAHRGNPAGFAGILAAIFASDEYQELQRRKRAGEAPPPPAVPSPSTPPPPAEPPEPTGYLPATQARVEAYMAAHPGARDRILRFVADNQGGDWHRIPEALELADWNAFVRQLGF